MFTIMAARRRNLAQDKGDPLLGMKAANRLNRLNSATAKGPASETGPFAPEGVGISVTVEPGPHPAEGAPADGMTPDEHAQAAQHHQGLANLYGKYAKPAQDTVPHTDMLNDNEKRELGPDINMERP